MQEVPGSSPGATIPDCSLAFDGAGDIFTARGHQCPVGPLHHVKLAGDGTPNPTRTPTVTPTLTPTTTPPQFVAKLVRGRKILVKDRDGGPARRKLAVDARDGAILPAPRHLVTQPAVALPGIDGALRLCGGYRGAETLVSERSVDTTPSAGGPWCSRMKRCTVPRPLTAVGTTLHDQ